MQGSELKNATVYTDFQGLSTLRREAGQNSEQALEKTAKQFEALFVQMMLKSMREAGQGEGMFDNDQSNLYRDMYDKQLSLHLSEKGEGMGLAKMLVQQLRSTLPPQQGSAPAAAEGALGVPPRGLHRFALQPPLAATAAAAPGVEASAVHRGSGALSFEGPEQFVSTLAPYARAAARRLGVDPRALLAQAALETGWGKAVISHADGSSSHNLFNIKADARWEGKTVARQTVEYRQGVAAREMAHFRSYNSLAESFNDYAEFLSSSPRYADALRRGGEAERYVEELQRAGYATDPAYAAKIKRIMSGETLATVGGLKDLAAETLSKGQLA